MITYKMHLIRTGKTSARQNNRYVGQLDAPLSEDGIGDLCEMRRDYEYPSAQMVFTSPLSRCAETAEILYPDIYTVEVPELIDMNLGSFEGKSFEELRGDADFSRWIQNSFENIPPGGEGLSEFITRITKAANDVFMQMMNEKITEAAIITHSGVIMTLLSSIGLPRMPLNEWAVENGAGYTLLFTTQMWMRDGAAEIYGRLPMVPIIGGNNNNYE